MIVQVVDCTTYATIPSNSVLQSSMGPCAPVFHTCKNELTERVDVKESYEILCFFLPACEAKFIIHYVILGSSLY